MSEELEKLNLSEEQKTKLELFILNNTDWTKKQIEGFVEVLSTITGYKNDERTI